MNAQVLSMRQQHEIDRQVEGLFGRNAAFRHLTPDQQRAIKRDTAKIVESLANGRPRATAAAVDPYAEAMGGAGTGGPEGGIGVEDVGPISQNPEAAQGNVQKLMSGKGAGKLGDSIQVGVDQAARMIKEIDFPTFVAKLIEGTFHAIVKSSIEQMKAYADMVKSVSTTLNEFKDRNTTDNQAADHLVSRYPQLFQINIVDKVPKVQARDDADTDHLPDFRKELGLSQDVGDLEDETIQNQLIPAARDDLARGRQQLLATIILMGINRIIVTDGKINAKIRFQFSANENRNVTAQAFDYVSMGTKIDATHQGEEQYTGASSSPTQAGMQTTGENRYATGQDTLSVAPDVRVTSQVDMTSDAKIQASGQIMGEVSVNFRSETFPLEKMVNTDQMFKLQEAGNGRGSLPAAAPGANPSAAASSAPAAAAPAAPATSTQSAPPAPTSVNKA